MSIVNPGIMFMYAAILVFVPAVVLTEPHHEALEAKIFNTIDSDKDGKLIKAEHDAFYGGFDLDKNGEINKEEFKNVIDNFEPAFIGHEDALYTMLDRDANSKVDKADIDNVFLACDSNKDGAIDKPEFRLVFGNIMRAVGHQPEEV
ncbi:hypothetical protein BsWGS_07057 [Bradybaena similaris]